MKWKLWACEDACFSVCVFAYLCVSVSLCVHVYVPAYGLASGQAGLYASNICRGLVRVLHGEAAEDT